MPPAGSNRLTYLVTDGPLCTPVLQEAFVGHPRNIHDHANTTLEGLVQERNRWDSIRKDAIDAGISHQGEINFDLIRFRELGPLAAFHRVFSASLRNPGTKASSNSGFKDDER